MTQYTTITENKDPNNILDEWTRGGTLGTNIKTNNTPEH